MKALGNLGAAFPTHPGDGIVPGPQRRCSGDRCVRQVADILSVQNLVETAGGEDPLGPLQQGLLAGLLDTALYRVG